MADTPEYEKPSGGWSVSQKEAIRKILTENIKASNPTWDSRPQIERVLEQIEAITKGSEQ